MAIRLHRCSNSWLTLDGHPCWKVEKSLADMGIDYEIVKRPPRRGKRDELERISGQRKYPVIEFDDGSAYRADSNDMAERIRAGNLFEGREGPSHPTGA